MRIALPLLLAIAAMLSLSGCQRDEPREVAKLALPQEERQAH